MKILGVSAIAGIAPAVGIGVALTMTACAPTHVKTTMQEYAGPPLPRPGVVLVQDFAVTPDQVTLDRGVSARVLNAMSGSSTTEQEAAAGRKVANAISETLVQEIEKLGLPAERVGETDPTTAGNKLIIAGQLLSVDEGNRTRRNLIGLGAGRTEVDAETQIYYAAPESGPQLVENFTAVAQSGRKPGAAETMGVGAVTERGAEMAVTSAGAGVASETLGANVDVDGTRMAKEIVAKLKPFFARQGWIPAAAH